MADRSVVVRLRAEIGGYRAAMQQAATATRNAAREMSREMTTSATANRQAWDQSGRALAAFGALAVGALALSVKAAMDWETAWTGVLKTVDGTPAQLAKVEDGLRGLARQLPISHAELAGVAEAAGQLGIATDDVVDFTKVMVDLGQTTNLTAADAATALARISNIMGTSAKDVSRMGATIVELGNNSATTEREIVEMGTRLAAAGKQAGLSEANIFAFASTLTSVGVNAEAGGTAFSKVFTRIGDAVRDGGDKLGVFAKVAGVSSAEFKRAFEQDSATAIAMFVEGMGDLANAGEGTTDIFKDLGLNNSLLKNAVLATGSASGLLAEQLQMANGAWEENTALLEEAEKRYATTESKIQSAKGSINDAAITMGEAFLPALASAAEGVSKFADTFGALPAPIQLALGATTGLVGGTALLAGGFLLLLPRIIETRVALMTLATTMPRTAAAARVLGGALKGVGLAAAGVFATAAAVGLLLEALIGGDAVPKAEALRKSIRGVATSGDRIGDLGGQFNNFGKILGVNIGQVDDLQGAFNKLLKPSTTDKITDTFTFLPGPNYMETLQNRVEGLDAALTAMVAEGDVENVKAFQASLLDMGYSAEDINKLLPDTIDALLGVSEAEKAAGGGADGLATSMGGVAAMTDEAAEAHAKWRDELTKSSAAFFSFGGAYDELVEKQIAAAQAQADATTKNPDDTWETYYDGLTISIDEYIAKLQEQVEAQGAWQANMTTIAQHVSKETFDELQKLGPEYASLIDQLAKEPERLKDVEGWFQTGQDNTTGYVDGIESIYMPELTIDATAEPALTVAADLQNELNNRGLAVPPWVIDANAAPAIGTAGYLQGVIDAKGAAVPDWMIDADTGPAILAADGAVASINDKTASIEVSANTGLATTLTEKWMAAFSGKSITVGVRTATGPGGQGGITLAGGGGVSGPGTGTSDSIPALLSNGEHVLTADDVQKAGGQSGVYRLRQAIQAGNLPAFASGGAVGDAFAARSDRLREWQAAYQRSVSVLGTDQYPAAKAAEDAAEDAWQQAWARIERLQASAADLAVEVGRGSVTSQASSGLSGAYSVVDRLAALSQNRDIDAASRADLARAVQIGEGGFRLLYSQAEGIESALKGARDRVSELGQISSGVASKLAGEFSLTDGLTQKNTNGSGDIWYTQTSIAAGAQAKADSIRSFAGKLASLQKMGLSGAVLQEVASLGSVEGGKVADNLLAAGAGEVGSLNSAFADIAAWSSSAGQYVTEGFYQGGLQAANGLIAGLESQQGAIEAQIADLAAGMEKELRRALGIASPSKVTTGIGAFTGEGLAVGIRSKRRAIAAAARDMAAAAVPDVAAVSAPVWASPMGYGSSGSSGPVQVNANIDKGAMSEAMNGMSMTLMVDGNPVKAIIQTEIGNAAVAVSRGY